MQPCQDREHCLNQWPRRGLKIPVAARSAFQHEGLSVAVQLTISDDARYALAHDE